MTLKINEPCVVALSGRTQSGKSSTANALHTKLGWPVASFGDYIRSEAQKASLATTRESLQAIGKEKIDSLGWREFCMRVLNHAGLSDKSVPCIIDGVRHLDALTTLRKLFDPAAVYLVHLSVSDNELSRRLEIQGISREQARAWEADATEQDVKEVLPSHADIVIQSDTLPASTVDKILEWLQHK